MPRICYVNGRYVNPIHAKVSMWDRGYQLADGVYEVIMFWNRRLLDEDRHIERLKRSLNILRIAYPMSDSSLKVIIREMLRKNPYRDGVIYIQVTRGVAKRGHVFPNPPVRPSLTMAVFKLKLPTDDEINHGVRVITSPDIRWQHCDIKSIALLPNVLAAQKAVEAGAKEVFLYRPKDRLSVYDMDSSSVPDLDNYFVTECSHSNAYMVTKDNIIVTHPANDLILNGVRRQNIIRIAGEIGIEVEERAFTLEELRTAKEAFLSSATASVLPVTKVDDIVIGDGKVGDVTKRLYEAYRQYVASQTGYYLPAISP